MYNKNIITHDINNADYILNPYKYSVNDNKFYDEYRKFNKKIINFYIDDDDSEIKLYENNFLFRTSLYKNMKDISIPSFTSNFKKEYNISEIIKKESPIVGFCGYYGNNIQRINSINVLNQTSDKISKNIILNNSFWGGNIWGEQQRHIYVENMRNSNLILCVRGSGNFSYRLYETFSSGRIPIIIDTDISLPFNNYINYNDSCIIINYNQINELENIILDFWEKNSLNDLIEKQKINYNIWCNYFSPYGFTNNFNKLLNTI